MSCSNAQNKNKNDILLKQIKIINKDYIETKDFFKYDLVKHFPTNLDSSYITFTESLSPDIGEVSLYLINKINDKNLLEEFSNKAIVTYTPKDTCLLIVNRFATKDDFYKIQISEENKELINLSCYDGLFPIPNFWNTKIASNENPCKLSNDFIIYVLEAQKGKFIDEKFLTDGRFMPESWKNGFSKGVAISEDKQMIIYWVVIW